ncbi:hypothetical protein CEXT_354001 [Caerostris extrusa]|uniref:Uncharacterized protein n=1 Tax=Caerostris extrusa TaxID=172846 RepID=A0AAV4PX62_CAEEX|nr:hypothetical protein CEXT_354001 [Caerostris extrusa]
MLNHLSARAFQRFAFHQDCGPIVRVVFIQITYFSEIGLRNGCWRGGVRVGHVEQVATDSLSKENLLSLFLSTKILSALQTSNTRFTK